MFHGLSLMNGEELAAVTHLLGIKSALPTEEASREAITTWLARTVKSKGKSPDELERAVLEWTATIMGVNFEPSLTTDDLERAIRLKIAGDAAEYLSPSWRIVCALVASGKKDNLYRKLSLMEQTASIAIPSSSALAEKRTEWNDLCAKWSNDDPRPELEPLVEAVGAGSELGRECLTLGLALSLLDGGIAFPTERLYKELADKFGMNSSEIDRLQKRVNDLYWQHHNAATPEQGRKEPGTIITEAARQTVYGAGALEALATDARLSLISNIELEPRSGWSKLVGGLSGMNPFFNKLQEPVEAVLCRIVYHTILKQHAEMKPEIPLEEATVEVVEAPPQPVQAPPQPLPSVGQASTAVTNVGGAPPPKALSMDPTPSTAAPAAPSPPPPSQPAAFTIPAAPAAAAPPPAISMDTAAPIPAATNPPAAAPPLNLNPPAPGILDEGAPLPPPKKETAKPPTTRSIKLDL